MCLYRQVGTRVARLARALAREGVRGGDHVGIYGVNCPEWVLAMMVRACKQASMARWVGAKTRKRACMHASVRVRVLVHVVLRMRVLLQSVLSCKVCSSALVCGLACEHDRRLAYSMARGGATDRARVRPLTHKHPTSPRHPLSPPPPI